ncbi:uncharacterized protein LACBIDRAFT_314105 [Laccaria bicolor S238N-H82]|uniref:Predicted protein n=1 Tax=Laccaria bicolor (strain S238N-H82 / ATCC MYA-4686) TaxID=486041 RepID=B0D1L4_LACBS|nr:uncharacterized protein LACBIDRAFT_314105 [Laccaria bicolor S238N-H82]EDR11661.1 predicted protein [Laccaria bicolor S238N-H82]|eukprot:XP_001877558.1 predicted protein [Laccaria bicolor S238N-H82]
MEAGRLECPKVGKCWSHNFARELCRTTVDPIWAGSSWGRLEGKGSGKAEHFQFNPSSIRDSTPENVSGWVSTGFRHLCLGHSFVTMTGPSYLSSSANP